MIGGQKISLRIFFDFPMSCANFAYRPYRIPLRTALSKKLKSPLTPICIFWGPIEAYDHWSLDTKQDAWFTASAFEAVFETINKKPKWIKVISDNGPHYYNSELMAIVSYWHNWYNVKVRSWLFLEPGEVKTMVDSHHASLSTNPILY